MKQGIDSTFGNALANTAMATVFVLIGLIYAWKLALILLAILPFVGGCGALMYIMSTSYKEKELKSYESAGQIVQSVLSAIKTVAAFNLQQKFLDMYKVNLNEAEYTTSRKGLVFGFFNGAVEGLLIVMFAVGLLYSTYLSQTECQTFGYSGIIATLVSVIQSFGALGNALSFLNSLSQGKTFCFFYVR
jgi:ABC-type bacteriocin/lantibiotic exporter with double-glycine peptidase domain